jgi:hypothetical protein
VAIWQQQHVAPRCALRLVSRRAGGSAGGAAGDSRQGLTGSGYDRHTFWGLGGFHVARAEVTSRRRPRATHFPGAMRRSTWRRPARGLGLAGVTFPSRTIRGRECSGYWPARTESFYTNGQRHVSVGVSDTVGPEAALCIVVPKRPPQPGGRDDEFERGRELELLVAGAPSASGRVAVGAWALRGGSGGHR